LTDANANHAIHFNNAMIEKSNNLALHKRYLILGFWA